MAEISIKTIIQCGRRIIPEEIDHIKEIVALFPQLSMRELASTICEHISWYTAAGNCKAQACEKLLRKLYQSGVVKLSEKQRLLGRKRPLPNISLTEGTVPKSEIIGLLREIGTVKLELVKNDEDRKLWNEYVERYHPMHYKQPFGYRLRYFISCKQGSLGCLLFAGAAKSLGKRDYFIGWTEQQRLINLAWIINNSRFLIFPWVKVKNLASHVLSRIERRISQDWEDHFNYRPVLMETFVDLKYKGSCYKAAGWKYLGMTTGEGLIRKGKTYTTNPKMIFVQPLEENFRHFLCSDQMRKGEI